MLSILIFAALVIGLAVVLSWFEYEQPRVCRKCNLMLSPEQKRCPRCGNKNPDNYPF